MNNTDKKRILIVVPFNIGTIGRCSLNLYKALETSGECEVKCIVVHWFENGFEDYNDCDFCQKGKLHGVNRVLAFWRQIKWLRLHKKNFKPDLTVSTLFGCSTISALSGGKDFKIGIFHSPHTQAKKDGVFNYLMTLATYHLIYPILDRLFCVSEEVKDSLRSFPFISDKKKKVVYNIHFPEDIRNKSEEELIDPKEAEILSQPTLLYCGRLDKNKAPDRAMIAFAKANKPENAQLVFIGNDVENMTDSLCDLAKRLSIDNAVHFFCKKENPYPYMKSAKALISSSYSEGLPGVIIESLILGTPVVSTHSSKGVWEIFLCSDQYDEELDSLYKCNCGIISSNLGKKQLTCMDEDTENLSESISLAYKYPRIEDFPFEEKIKPDGVIKEYLNQE